MLRAFLTPLCVAGFILAPFAPATEPQAAQPVFSPAAGTYTAAQTVKIGDATSGATIYYTTDGSTPTTASHKYTAPIAVAASEKIEAIAVAKGYTASAIAAAAYTIEKPAAIPTYAPAAGTYAAAQTVKISDTTTGATIYYTTDGSTPTTASHKYTAAIAVTASQKIEAIAVAKGYASSAIAAAAYTIEKPAATPTYSPAAGTYAAAQTVKISDTTTGATIYYTTDGSTPTTASHKYTAPIAVAASEKIEAIAAHSGYANSALAAAAYTIEKPTPAPIFTPSAGKYTSAQSIKLSDSITGSTIYYTVGGATPTTSSAKYVNPIAISSSTTFKAIAVAKGDSQSAVATAAYIIAIPPPVASLLPSTLSFSQAVNSESAPQTLTLTNKGGATLDIGKTGLTGTNASSFLTSNTCGATIAVNASCQILIRFYPKAAGAVTASLTVADNASSSPQSVALTGTGISQPTISAITSSNPIPLTPIQITLQGISASANSKITFTDGAGYSFTESPIRVASNGTVIAATPMYISSAGVNGPGKVSVTITDSGKTTLPFTLSIQDLPTVGSYGVQPGQLSRALLVFQSIRVASAINGLQAVQGSAQNTVKVASTIATLSGLAKSLTSARANVDQLMLNPALSIPQAKLPDGTTISLDAHALDLMDRVAGVLLSGQFGQIVAAAVPATTTARPLNVRYLHPARRVTPPQIPLMSASGSSRARPRWKSRQIAHPAAAPTTTIGALLTALQAIEASGQIVKGTLGAINAGLAAGSNSVGTTIVDVFSSIAGGVGPIGGLGDSAASKLFGAYAGALGNLNTIATCLTDDSLYLIFKATGQDAAANEVVQDLSSIDTKQLIDAGVSLLVAANPFSEAIAVAGTAYTYVSDGLDLMDFAQKYSGSDLQSANQTAQDVVAEGSTLDTSGAEGIGLVEGQAPVSSETGDPDPTPESGVEITPAPGGGDLDTLTDTDGDFMLLVPFGQTDYDYSDVDLSAYDPTTQDVLDTASTDLSGASYDEPVTVDALTTADRYIGLVVGDNSTDTGLATATISVSQTQIGSGGDGIYVICDVPDNTTLSIEIQTDADLTDSPLAGLFNFASPTDVFLTSATTDFSATTDSCATFGYCTTLDFITSNSGLTLVNGCVTIPGVNDGQSQAHPIRKAKTIKNLN